MPFSLQFTYEFDLAEIQKYAAGFPPKENRRSCCLFRRVLRVSVWNNILTVGNRVLGEVDIVLSQIDWSKENASDYALATLDASIFFQT